MLNGPEALAAQGGQYPPHVKDQLSMYGDLVYNTPGLTDDRARTLERIAAAATSRRVVTHSGRRWLSPRAT